VAQNPEKTKVAFIWWRMVGHIISKDRVVIDLKKIEPIERVPFLKTKWVIKVFLGGIDFYWYYVLEYATISKPLARFLKKDVWPPKKRLEAVKFVEILKGVLCYDLILKPHNWTKPFIVYTNDSWKKWNPFYSNWMMKVIIIQFIMLINKRRKPRRTIQWPRKKGWPSSLFSRNLVFICLETRLLLWEIIKNWMLLMQEFDLESKHWAGATHANVYSLLKISIEVGGVCTKH
jgi:hypothetical protein